MASILLVDDNEDNLLALEAVLERLGARLVRASSGSRMPWPRWSGKSSPWSSLDVQMPWTLQPSNARLLNARRTGDPTPLIFLPANFHDQASQLQGYAEGAVDYLVKPFEPAVLRSKVTVFVALFQARKQVALQSAMLREHAFEAQRREGEARYQALAEAMPQAVWTADATGRLDYCNRQWFEYTGLDPSQLADSWTRVHPDDRPAVWMEFERAQAERRPFEVLYRVRRASDGSYRWHLGRATPTRDAAGRVVRWIGTATEVDAQRRGGTRPASWPRPAMPGRLARPRPGPAASDGPGGPDDRRPLCSAHAGEGQRVLHLSADKELLALLEAEGPDPLEPLGWVVLSTGLTVAWSTPAVTDGRQRSGWTSGSSCLSRSSAAGQCWEHSPWASARARKLSPGSARCGPTTSPAGWRWPPTTPASTPRRRMRSGCGMNSSP
jgi:PAS domain S-box-containing protein